MVNFYKFKHSHLNISYWFPLGTDSCKKQEENISPFLLGYFIYQGLSFHYLIIRADEKRLERDVTSNRRENSDNLLLKAQNSKNILPFSKEQTKFNKGYLGINAMGFGDRVKK